ncbi:unnamed protein product [Cuscuta epithymum]|uniref:DYW domain-containing protein n=2 Tax=Cuscuta epithymum TaxID=186058 RepID=A0AAV0GHV5_9ASTE|nr:unnamed protein product [Cuscuta epithymum]CAH9147544.1 unnamed protein product [Cuscuta epithymum]
MLGRQSLAEALGVCANNSLIVQGKLVHAATLRRFYGSDLIINNYLIDMYAKCSRIIMAQNVFDKMPARNVVSWTALMCGYLQVGAAKDTLLLLSEMIHSDARPNEVTFSTNFKACGILGAIGQGRQIHCFCGKSGFEWNQVVGNSLIDMYARCGKIAEAENMFFAMPDKRQITWNSMISGYALQGMGQRCLTLFKQMQEHGETPDNFTFASTLKACTSLRAIREGNQIHGFLIVRGLPIYNNKVTSGALIDMYAKCGTYLLEAQKVFDLVEPKSILSWTSLIIGYAQQGNLMKSFDLFKELREESELPIDEILVSSLMGVFADFALVEPGKQLHSYSIKLPCGLNTPVLNSVIDMYLKCGFINEAERLFGDMQRRSVITWTTMITGYGKYGIGRKAVELFKRMDFEPDGVTYLALLTACSHSGLIEESQRYFSRLCKEPKVKPQLEHYSCMVDALGRAGRLIEAKNHIENNVSLKSNPEIWKTLLSACRTHKNVDLGAEVGDILLRLEGDNPSNYVMLSNLYADINNWKQSENLRFQAKAKGLKKEAGQSWVEIKKKMHFFYNRDERHPLTESIHKILKEMERRMKAELGYAHTVSLSLHDVEDESREESLMFHSEKLAIGLALIHDNESGINEAEPVRVFKNLRVCGDCHEFIKGLSKILKKKVFLVRDANRFHKFENGDCSCGDYW